MYTYMYIIIHTSSLSVSSSFMSSSSWPAHPWPAHHVQLVCFLLPSKHAPQLKPCNIIHTYIPIMYRLKTNVPIPASSSSSHNCSRGPQLVCFLVLHLNASCKWKNSKRDKLAHGSTHTHTHTQPMGKGLVHVCVCALCVLYIIIEHCYDHVAYQCWGALHMCVCVLDIIIQSIAMTMLPTNGEGLCACDTHTLPVAET